MNVHALICAYNEAGTVGEVVRRTQEYVSRVVVVDDGSDDGTADVAREAGADVLVHPANRGKGAAVVTGLEEILAGEATHVLFIDADLQHEPEDIPRFVERCREGADVVVGTRFGDREQIPRHRYLANAIGSRILSLFAGTRLEDTQSGYRLISAEVLRGMTIERDDFSIETEILLKSVAAGATVAFVPIQAIYFEGRNSRFRPVRDTVRISLAALRFRFRGPSRSRSRSTPEA